MNIEAIAFDLDNTLYHRDNSVNAWIRSTFAHDPELAEEGVRFDNSGYIPRRDFYTWVSDRVDWASSWKDAEARFQSEIWPFIQLESGVLNAVHELSSTYRLALLTNGDPGFQLKKFRNLGEDVTTLFDESCVFATGDIGHHKPDARSFEAVLDALDLPAENVVYVGDNPANDVGGARAVGMRACWIQLTDAHDASQYSPDWTIQSVAELPALMKRVNGH